jgi:uncharacterized membrane protein
MKGKRIQTSLPATILHDGFEIGIIAKGIHALLEVAGGIFLWFVRPESLSNIVRALTQNELSEDPNDFLANFILQASAHYSMSSRHFGMIYLLSHGAIKLVLVVLLWRRILWAYPLGVGALVLFIAYQLARWTGTHSLFLLLLSLFDAFMIVLTIIEYRRLRAESSIAKS